MSENIYNQNIESALRKAENMCDYYRKQYRRKLESEKQQLGWMLDLVEAVNLAGCHLDDALNNDGSFDGEKVWEALKVLRELEGTGLIQLARERVK